MCLAQAKPTTAHRRANSSVGTMDMPYSGLKQIPTEFDYWRDNIPVKVHSHHSPFIRALTSLCSPASWVPCLGGTSNLRVFRR